MKRFFLLIPCALVFGALIFFVLMKPKPASTALTAVTEEQGNRTVTSFVDDSGNVIFASDKGYASVRKTFNDEGKNILEEYLGTDGRPVMIPAGYAAVERVYTDGLATEIRYLDLDGAPVNISSGYAVIRRSYDDTTGKLIRQQYYEASGMPAARSSDDSYGYELEYDEQGRIIRQIFLGPDGLPRNIRKGYATIITGYLPTDPEEETGDDGGVSVKREYFDQNGERATIGRFQYGTLTDPSGTAVYLDVNGMPMFRLDNFLLTHPVFVMCAALVLMLLAVTLRGKARTAFLIAYLVFILFMTVMYREEADSKASLELFHSYRQFMVSAQKRYEILNNIWLFIPLGACLGTIAAEQKRCAVLLLPLLFSVLIESAQYVFGIGLCDIDDVISNSLGALTGFVTAMLLCSLQKAWLDRTIIPERGT